MAAGFPRIMKIISIVVPVMSFRINVYSIIVDLTSKPVSQFCNPPPPPPLSNLHYFNLNRPTSGGTDLGTQNWIYMRTPALYFLKPRFPSTSSSHDSWKYRSMLKRYDVTGVRKFQLLKTVHLYVILAPKYSDSKLWISLFQLVLFDTHVQVMVEIL